MSNLISFGIEALFFTDLWIIIYNPVINFLNFLFPVVEKVSFYRSSVAIPETFEMPLYLLFSVIFVTIIWFVHKLSVKLDRKISINKKNPYIPIAKAGLLIFLLLVFLTKLGSFPLANDSYPYSLRTDSSIYSFVLFLYIISIGIIILEFTVINKYFSKHKFFPLILYALVAIIIAFFIFEPRFPISPIDFGFYFGPIWEVVHGKTIFTDIVSQYGFLSILFFSALFKWGIFTFSQLAIYNWILTILEYFICFYLTYKISKSLWFALTGLFSILTINYFSFYILPLTLPQYAGLRRLPFFLVLYLFYKLRKIDSFPFVFIFSLLAFWTVDTGLQMIMAFALTAIYLVMGGYIGIKTAIKSLFLLFTSLAGVLLTINLLHLFFGYEPIKIFEIIGRVRQYAVAGVSMLPIVVHTYFWFMILVYLATMIYVFRKNEKNKGLELLIFTANFSLFACLYFVGRSDDASLIVVSIFPLLNLFLLIGHTYKNYKLNRSKIVMGFVLFLLLVLFPVYNRRFTLTELILQKYHGFLTGNIFKPELETNLKNRFTNEKALITKYLPGKDALILSSDDTYLFYVTGKNNLLDDNPESGIVSTDEMDFALKTVKKNCPHSIAVDCSIVNKCEPFTPFSKGEIRAGDILKAVESLCHTAYQPTICTNQLCIAYAQ